jgi:hypothetical protein
MERILSIGDTVAIKNYGMMYTTYHSKFIEMGFTNPDLVKRAKKIKGKKFTIFSKGIHTDNKRRNELFGIQDNEGNQYLFAKSGLRSF